MRIALSFSMTLQSGRPVSQMQYVRHLLGANCCQGWWHGKSDLQCRELSCRYIIHIGSHSRVVFLNTILIVIQIYVRCTGNIFSVHCLVYSVHLFVYVHVKR